MSTLEVNSLIHLDASSNNLDLDSSGNVAVLNGKLGVGTASPSVSFQVTTSANDIARFAGANNNIYMHQQSSNNMAIKVDSGSKLHFMDGTDTNLTITSAGNVGIGTTSPSAPLHVNGNSYLIAGSHGIEGNADPTNYLINTTSGILDIKWFGGVRFLTNGSTERMRVTSNGLCFNGDTAAANALDDYEEGTFTPTILAASGAAGSYNQQSGFYNKVGRQVTCHFYVYLANKGTLSGNLKFSGFPFTNNSAINTYQTLTCGYWAGISPSIIAVGGFMSPGNSYVSPRANTGAAGNANRVLTGSDISNTSDFMCSITYNV